MINSIAKYNHHVIDLRLSSHIKPKQMTYLKSTGLVFTSAIAIVLLFNITTVISSLGIPQTIIVLQSVLGIVKKSCMG